MIWAGEDSPNIQFLESEVKKGAQFLVLRSTLRFKIAPGLILQNYIPNSFSYELTFLRFMED